MKIVSLRVLAIVMGLVGLVGDACAVGGPADIVVYYFHRTGRCHTCLAMEGWTRQVVAGESSARVALQVINLDLPENEHYVKDYEITFNTVVVQNTHTAEWRNLADVWEYSEDEAAFRRYLQNELDLVKAARGVSHK